MTWAKFGTEYFDRLAEVDFPEALEDACVRSAAEAHSYMFSCITPDDVERDSISFKKRLLGRATMCPKREEAAEELVRLGLWRDAGDRYEIIHGRSDIKAGIMAQHLKLERDKRAQQVARSKKGGR